jgi:hypothetical protein
LLLPQPWDSLTPNSMRVRPNAYVAFLQARPGQSFLSPQRRRRLAFRATPGRLGAS